LLEGKYELHLIKNHINKDAQKKFFLSDEAKKEIDETLSHIKNTYFIITIDEILSKFLEHLNNSTFAEWVKEEITVMMIDEAQDLDTQNFKIFETLLEINPNLKLFLVGDPRQNIFKFRGGLFSHLENFLNKFNNKVSRKNLSISFRNPQNILDLTNSMNFTDCNNVRLSSHSKEQDNILVLKKYRNIFSEDDAIINLIQEINDFKSTAIIASSVSYFEYIVQRLNDLEIPFKVFGGYIFLQEHIRIIQHLLRIIDSENTYSINYICNKLNIKINKGKKDKWTDAFYKTQEGKIIKSIRNEVNAGSYNVSKCLKDLEYFLENYILNYELKEEAIDNLNKLINISEGFNTIEEFLLSFATDKEKYYEFYKRDKDFICKNPNEENFVTLSTIHSAKGLEWDHIIMPRMCEGFFPNNKKCCEGTPEQVIEKYNDELKKFFVAVTRTKKNLYFTYPAMYKGFNKIKSRFIKDLPEC
jgi:DNA helicase-2/ATP-dependent DNA helicase PcrA